MNVATVILENVSAHFPIYGAQQRSLRKALLQRSTGGSIEREGKNNERVSVRALTNISLTLNDGDRVGLVGHNGAGKSTLLKVIAGIYEPVSGTVKVEGRVTPLFDTLPGLDSEDTGYENIITSGMLIGMTREQIEAKIPEIEEFCELGEYLSLPVRTYSTGMTMRLGFALVTALDPGVLLMDEGFGTGDLRFAERAQARMRDFVGRSRIMVLASHSDKTIRSMCNKAVLLEAGKVVAFGPVDEICDHYYKTVHVSPQPMNDLATRTDRSGTGSVRFTKVRVFGDEPDNEDLKTGAPCTIILDFTRNSEAPIRYLNISIGIDDSLGNRVALLSSDVVRPNFDALLQDVSAVEIKIPRLPLVPDKYRFTLFASIDNVISDWVLDAGGFDTQRGVFFENGFLPPAGQGNVVFDYKFVAISRDFDSADTG